MRLFSLVPLVASLFLSLLSMTEASAHAPEPNAPATVVVDTAVVEIALPEGAPACISFSVSPDTLGFGLAAMLQMKFDDNTYQPLTGDLKPSASWLTISPNRNSSETDLVVFDIHASRLNPFRIKVGQTVGPVLFVAAATTDLSETAAMRMPRGWATRWWMLLLASLLLTALIIGVWWLWRRRLRLEPMDQWAPAPPAWLQSSVELRKLLEDDFPGLNNSRDFLDQLANITRGYLACRYLVHAGELTSGEILASCLSRGHDSRSLRRMISILQGLDHSRYNPDPPVVSWCRIQANDLVDAIDDVRIIPRYTHVEASLLLEAEKAWSWLHQPENRLSESASVQGGAG